MMDADEGEHLTLSDLGGPGEVEWWFRDEPDERLTIDNLGRVRWAAAVDERTRDRAALYALGYEFIERTLARYEVGHILPTYIETWISERATITVAWNVDPTSPLQ